MWAELLRVALAGDFCRQTTFPIRTPATSSGPDSRCPVGTIRPLFRAGAPVRTLYLQPTRPLHLPRAPGSLADAVAEVAGALAGLGARVGGKPRSHPEQAALCRERSPAAPPPPEGGDRQSAAPMRAEGAGAGRGRARGCGRGGG